jgi:AcrR family transcriptional regulator
MTEATGAADRDRTLALLWRQRLGEPQGSRGRKQRHTVDQVVDAAIALADEDGLEALSMRKVAERLGLGTMSLYTYVESKTQLVELMLDQVIGALPRREPSGSWRDRLAITAHDELEGYLRHAWMLQVDTSRPPLGPGTSDWFEYAIAPLDGLGLTDLEMDAAVATLGALVAATARSSVNADRARTTSGQTDTEWWEANLPVLEQVMTEDRWPVSSRVGQTVGQTYNAVTDPLASFEFGLTAVLDGIESRILRGPTGD